MFDADDVYTHDPDADREYHRRVQEEINYKDMLIAELRTINNSQHLQIQKLKRGLEILLDLINKPMEII